jgi:hypothetical protein
VINVQTALPPQKSIGPTTRIKTMMRTTVATMVFQASKLLDDPIAGSPAPAPDRHRHLRSARDDIAYSDSPAASRVIDP